MGFHSHHSVDRDHRAVISSTFENRLRLPYGTRDLTDGSATVVDKFIANADSVDDTPIPIDGADNGLTLILHLVDVENAQKEGNAFSFRGGDDVSHLVTVGTVEPDNLVTVELRKIAGDLG